MYTIYSSMYSRSLLINSLVISRFKINKQFIRLIMSDRDIKIASFIELREIHRKQLGDRKDVFIKKMEENVDNPRTKVFTQDLNLIMALAETNDDIDLTLKVAKKYIKQSNKKMSFYGPILMRLLHVKRKPSEALELFNNEDSQPGFMFITSVSILMDLLYESRQYDDAVQVYNSYCDHLTKDTNTSVKLPGMPSNIAFACYAQMNTEESLAKAKELFNICNKTMNYFRTRPVVFLAYLAIQRQEFEFALETINTLDAYGNNIALKNMKILALLGLQRYGDAVNVLYEKSGFLCIDVVNQMEQSLTAFGNDAYLKEFVNFKQTSTSLVKQTLKSRVFMTVCLKSGDI